MLIDWNKLHEINVVDIEYYLQGGEPTRFHLKVHRN